MFDFSRRFIVSDPEFAAAIAAASIITDQILVTSPKFVSFAKSVRAYSILLGSLKYTEIYHAVTCDCDPEIGFLLLSAERQDGTLRFNIQQVESMLWGTPTISTYSDYAQGIGEVSAKLAAAIFIGAYATQPYQHTMAEFLRKQALLTLDKTIVLQTKLAAGNNTGVVALEKVKEARFYFDPVEITLGAPLKVSFFIPNFKTSANWVPIVTYPTGTKLHTRRVAADIALAINRYTLDLTNNSNIIAAVTQSGENSYPFIDFALRSFVEDYNGDLVSVQFEDLGGNTDALPFRWGIETNDLHPTFINSCLLLQRSLKATGASKSNALATISAAAKASLLEYNVLYFRNKIPAVLSAQVGIVATSVSSPAATGQLTYRLSATESIVHTATVDRGDAPRYSQQAIALMNGLQAATGKTRLLGCIVRDDPSTALAPVSAVELLAWAVTSPVTYLVLDVLTVPDDIEIALGNIIAPQTPFSSLPLSIVCKPLFEKVSTSSSTSTPQGGQAADIAQIRARTSDLMYSIRDKTEFITGYTYN